MSHADIAERIAEAMRLTGAVSQLTGQIAVDASQAQASMLSLSICRLLTDAEQNRATLFIALAIALRTVVPLGQTERVWLAALVQLVSELSAQQATHDGPVSVQ